MKFLFQGENLNLAAEKGDVTVKIGLGSCEVIELTGNNLTCVPPNKQPVPTVPGGNYPEVNVRDDKPLAHNRLVDSATTNLWTDLFPVVGCLASF